MVDVSTKAFLMVKKEEREYHFSCSNSSSLGEIYDVLREMTAYVVEKVNDFEKTQQPKQGPDEAPKEV